MDDNPRMKNAKNSMLMQAAEASVKMLSAPSLILFVIGTADDAADTNRYAVIYKIHSNNNKRLLKLPKLSNVVSS